jgi:hypothetical protein
MRRMLPAWLTAMPWTLRSGDVCQNSHTNALGGIKPPPSSKEADMMRHESRLVS